MRRIATDADIQEAIAELVAADPRLGPIVEIAGPLPLRLRPGGFEGLAAIITAQQISSTAAAAIWARLEAAVAPFTARQFLSTTEDALRGAGLSRPKVRTLTGVAAAVANGFDLDALDHLPAHEAIASLVVLNGIGPWTAESYLLFCLGQADIFPAGDLALQIAVQHALRLDARPGDKKLRGIAAEWSPWRGVAARLFWAYYREHTVAQKQTRARPNGVE